MDDGLKPAKSTGYTQSTSTENESVSVQPKSLENKKPSPVLRTAPTKDESTISTAEVLVSKILAIQVMMGDFKALKAELPASRESSGNGKIYWSAELPGHILAIENGKLLVDGKPVDSSLEKLLAIE
jgi:hypothetical protein